MLEHQPLDRLSAPALRLACELRRMQVGLTGERRTARGRADHEAAEAIRLLIVEGDNPEYRSWLKHRFIVAALREMGARRVRVGRASRLHVIDKLGTMQAGHWRDLKRHAGEFLDLLCGPDSAPEGDL